MTQRRYRCLNGHGAPAVHAAAAHAERSPSGGARRDGHDRAFEAIVERYRRPLQRYLRRLLSEPLAEDVLQASFVRAWQALRAGTEVRDLRPWLYRIAHNQALNTLRAAGSALPAVTEELPAVSLETEVVRREELRETLHGIQAFPIASARRSSRSPSPTARTPTSPPSWA